MPPISLNASQKTKQTPAGEIPVDWGCVKLREIVKPIQSGASVSGEDRPPNQDELGVLKVSAVTSGSFLPEQSKCVTGSEINRLKQAVTGPSILVNRANGSADLVGAAVMVHKSIKNLFLPDKLWQIEPHLDKTALNFIGALVTSPHFRKIVLRRSSGGTGMMNISSKAYLSIPIPFPPLPEQRKIADILSTWDRALETLDQFIAAKTRRKQALMQQLLTGKKRLPGFDRSQGKRLEDRFGNYPSDWQHVFLGEIVTEVGTRNRTSDKLPVLSSTKHHGLVLSEEYFGKKVYANDTSNYRVVKRGEFAYATNHIEEGSIGYQSICDAGLVSPIYTVFKSKSTIDDSYLYRLLKSPLLIHLYQVNTNASVDRRGSLRYKEFAKIKVWLPGKEEQTAIAQVLDTADHELRLLKQQRTALEKQKRGLMQQLLTGRKRVKYD